VRGAAARARAMQINSALHLIYNVSYCHHASILQPSHWFNVS
jgi:hypothetical protein